MAWTLLISPTKMAVLGPYELITSGATAATLYILVIDKCHYSPASTVSLIAVLSGSAMIRAFSWVM